MTLTFIDSGVLIAAARGEDAIAQQALAVLIDDRRTFASSRFVMLEVLPKATYHQQLAETAFYEFFFNSVCCWAADIDGMTAEGYRIASEYGLSAVDALHVAGALQTEAVELVTTERRTKPIHRVEEIKVISLFN